MGFWDVARGAAQVISRVMPECHICGAPGAQLCYECQQVGCHRHTYSNLSTARSICSSCLAKNFDWATSDLAGTVPEDWPYEQTPWEILGVEPGASREDITRAHREASKLCHPDHCGGDTEQQIAVNRAREVLMAQAM